MKARTKKFAVDVIRFCDTLKASKAASVITYQLVKSSSSTAANYRATCRSRSKNEFYSKISIVVEESDESHFWLEVIDETDLSNDKQEGKRLLDEAIEITKIMSKSRASASNNR